MPNKGIGESTPQARLMTYQSSLFVCTELKLPRFVVCVFERKKIYYLGHQENGVVKLENKSKSVT